MTFAELVIKFETQGNDKVLRDVRNIEVELKKVSSSSLNAANRFQQSFGKISASIKGVNFSNINSGMSQMSTTMTPAMSSLQSTISTISLLNIALKDNSAGVFAKNFTKAFASLKIDAASNLHKRMLKDFETYPKRFGIKVENIDGKTSLKPLDDQTEKQARAFEKFAPKRNIEMLRAIAANRLVFSEDGRKDLAKYAEGLQGVISGFAGVSSAILEVGKAVTVALSAVYALNAALIKSTVEAAFEVEQLQQRLEALTTPEKATDILSFVRKLAEPSNFTTQQLAEASVQLEAFGLNSKRILPIMAQLGMAFGADAEKLRLLTDMFGRLGQGQLPDQQVMAQFGISKSKLMKEGIKFDNQGSLVSSTREVMIAIEKIVTRDYGAIFDKMAKTGNAKLASLTDVFDRLKVSVGQSLMDTAKNAISGMTDLLSAIERTGILQKVAQSMLLPFQAIANVFTGKDKSIGNIQATMANWAGGLLAIFEEINIQTALFVEQFARVSKLALLFQSGQALPRYKEVGGLISDIFKGARGTFAPGRVTQKGTDYSMMILDQLQNPPVPTSIDDLINKSKLTDFGKLEDLLKGDKAKKDKSQTLLEKIQQNTKTQNEITLRNLTYGGGELAAQGLSAVQMSGFRSVGSPGVNAGNDIVRGVEKIVRGYSNSNNLNFSFKRS
jgi:hypothetical protein